MILRKMVEALNDGGRIAFSVKGKTEATKDGFSDEKLGKPRYFHYYTEDELKSLLEKVGLPNTQIVRREGFRGVSWLTVITSKEENSG